MMQMKRTLPGLDNFYMIGHWTTAGRGLPLAVSGGRDVIQLVCKKGKKLFVSTEPMESRARSEYPASHSRRQSRARLLSLILRRHAGDRLILTFDHSPIVLLSYGDSHEDPRIRLSLPCLDPLPERCCEKRSIRQGFREDRTSNRIITIRAVQSLVHDKLGSTGVDVLSRAMCHCGI